MTALYDTRKTAVVFILITFLLSPGYSDDSIQQITFNTESGAAFIYGEAKEIVYNTSSGTELLSLLVYPIPPGIGAYVGMEARWRDLFLARLRLETAWPLTTGNLTDDDWIYVSSFSDDPDVHSDSTAHMTGWFHTDFIFGMADPGHVSRIETLVGLTLRQMHWEAWDAEQEATAPGYSSGIYNGQVLDYRQRWVIPWFGFEVERKKTDSTMNFYLRLSPWMWAEGRDIHILTGMTYIDVMHGGIMLAAGIGASRLLTGKLWLTGSLSADIVRGIRGDTYEYANGTPATARYLNMAGGALTLLSCYLGFSVHP